MENQIQYSRFAKLYVWFGRAKYTMGLFTATFALFYLFFGYICEGPAIKLDFLTFFQMTLVCFIIGVIQQAIIPSGALTRGRAILWSVLCIAIIQGFCLICGWFEAFPLWCLVAFIVCTAICFPAMIVMYYFELFYETKQLNRCLEQFQNKKR